MLVSQIGTILKARWGSVTLVTTVVVTTALALQLTRPPVNVAETSILVDFRTADPATGGVIPPVYLPTYLANQIDIVRSRHVATKVVERLAAETPIMDASDDPISVESLLSDLSLSTSKQASVIYIRYVAQTPQLAADVANAFADSYVDAIQEMRTDAVRQRTAWFGQQLEVLRDNVVTAQEKLAAVQQETGIVSLDERLDVENAKLLQLSRQLVDAQTQSQDAVSRARQARKLMSQGGGIEALTDLVGNAFIQNLRTQLAKEESRLSELSSQLGSNHPQYERAATEVTNLRKRVNSEIRAVADQLDNQATLLAEQLKGLEKDIAAQKDKILRILQARGRVDVVLRELESTQRAYDAALAELSKTHLEGDSTQTSATVLNRAVGIAASAGSSLVKIGVYSVALGLLLGMAFALVAERVDRRVRSPADITALLGLPVLGVLAEPPSVR